MLFVFYSTLLLGNNMKKINLTVVGAGSTYTLGIMSSLVSEKANFPLRRVVFYDIDAPRQELNAKATEIMNN